MTKIKIHAGDFIKGRGELSFNHFSLPTKAHPFLGEEIPIQELEALEIATEDSVKKIGGTLGWGAAGAVVLGPAGLLAGLLLGGKRKEITFAARFKDGRKLLATTDSKTFARLQAAIF